MLKGIFVLATHSYQRIYSEAERADIGQLVQLYAPPQTPESIQADPALLYDADVLLTGWGGPRLDTEFLDAAPHLKAVFYGAGSIKGIVTEAFWERDILITTAAAANAVPVAEFTLAQIIYSLKRGWQHVLAIKEQRTWVRQASIPGTYDRVVGLISLGLIGREVAELLRHFDMRVIAYDPLMPPEDAAALGVTLCGLDEVFAQADVVSLHAPWLPTTEGLITGNHFAAMKPYSTFINTARGAIVREDEMIAVLEQRPDLFAVIDVTYPEPPVPGSPLYTLPNVALTPHIAGSIGSEDRRLGRYVVDELRRYVAGEPLRYAISRERFEVTA